MTMHEEVIQGFRLSPQQERIWRLEATQPNRFRTRCSVSLSGALDLERFQQAVNEVVSRNEILRTSFYFLRDRNDPLQVIDKHSPAPLEFTDLRDTNVEEQRAAIQNCVAKMRDEPFDLTNRPPLRWRLFRNGGPKHFFLLPRRPLVFRR